jgi:hemin uptake protein HemP
MTDNAPQTPLDTPLHTGEVTSARLLGSRGELIIIHNGQRYTLRITANRKLILSK